MYTPSNDLLVTAYSFSFWMFMELNMEPVYFLYPKTCILHEK